MAERRTGWFATAPHLVGNLARCETVYTWDGTLQESRALAISHGFGSFEHDDFNVGRIEDGRLVWFGWMDEQHPAEDYPEVARALGLRHG